MKVVDIADETYRELESPTDLSLAAIVFWLQTNMGELNVLINTHYSLSASREIVDTNGDEISDLTDISIYKQIYKVYRAKALVRRHLGAASLEAVIEIDADGSSVRRVNKTTLAAEYRQLLKEEQASLDDLIKTYGINGVLPLQVAGDDTVAACYNAPLDSSIPRIR